MKVLKVTVFLIIIDFTETSILQFYKQLYFVLEHVMFKYMYTLNLDTRHGVCFIILVMCLLHTLQHQVPYLKTL